MIKKLKKFEKMLYTLDYEPDHQSKVGTKKKIEGVVFSVKPEYWIISTPKREKVIVPHVCPAKKGDIFCAIGTLMEEDPDIWNIENPPMVKIALEEVDIKTMIKQSFRCSLERADSIFFHLSSKARNYHISVHEYIDESIGCYLRVPSETVLDLMFPKNKKEDVLRFFRWWSAAMIRRIELIGISKEKLRELNKPPSEIYKIALENPFNIPDLDMETAKEVLKRTNKSYEPIDEKCAHMLRYLNKQLENGHTYVMYQELNRMFQLTEKEFYHLEKFDIKAERETGRVFLRDVYNTNHDLVNYLCEKLKVGCPQRDVDMNIMDPKLNMTQRTALFFALKLPLCIITGKGGTGKSVLIGEIYKQEPTAQLLSFTGKAVARLAEITKTKDPSTIHKAIAKLEISESTKHVIIDEATLAYTELIVKLFKSFPYPKYNFRITFVGDDNQLTPLQWGAFFSQLIDSQKIPTFKLEQNMRVATDLEQDGIILNCNKLLAHDRHGLKTKPFFFDLTPNFHVLDGGADEAINLLVTRYDAGYDISDTVILTPYKDAVREINLKCQAHFRKGKRSIRDNRGNEWCIGNPICNRVNNYFKDIMNGSRGTVHDIEKDKVIVKMNGEFITFSTIHNQVFMGKNYLYEEVKPVTEEEFCNTNTLSLDYASTVHSAQGSEWSYVIIYIPKGHKANLTGFISHHMVYTMLSRAKRKIWIVGGISDLYTACAMPYKKKNDNFIELFNEKFKM